MGVHSTAMTGASAESQPNEEAAAPEVATFPLRYKLIRGEDWLDLSEAVNKACAEGWTPLGGFTYVPLDPIAAMKSQDVPNPFYQAMYR